jgi:dTDP-4-amino-4,6-dideoxygalactose transaminase
LGAQYGRTYGALTASGASAIEAALRHLGVTAGAEVILPDTGCYKIGAAVLREGAVPVFTAVGPGLVLSADAVAVAVTSRTRCVVAVHQYGLPCPVADLRTALPDGVKIIEDAAQSWDTLAEGRPVGRDGDVVVASFGRTKPVPLGAGARFSVTNRGWRIWWPPIARRTGTWPNRAPLLRFRCLWQGTCWLCWQMPLP